MFGLLNALPPRIWRDFSRHFRNSNYERDDDGHLLIAKVRFKGIHRTHADDGLGVVETPNLVSVEGFNYLLSAGVGNGTRYGTFYLAPFSGNVTVLDTWTAATFASTATELTTQYSQSTRVEFVESTASAGAMNNTANPAVFTAATTSVSIWGAGLLSTSTKGATSGVLLSAVKYASVRSLAAVGDKLSIEYTLSCDNA